MSMATTSVTAAQLKALVKVFKVKKLLVVRYHSQEGNLEVAWRHPGGGLVYRWIGPHGKFVYK